MENFILIFLALGLGVLLKRTGAFPDNSAQVLNLFVIWVSLPALILVRIPTLEISTDLAALIVTPWVMLAISAAAVLGAGRLFDWPKPVVGGLLLAVPLGNTSFLGLPMIQAFYGDALVPLGLLYDQLGTFPALATFGAVVVAVYGGGDAPTAKSILTRIFTFPPFLALLFAFALRSWPLPIPLIAALEVLAATLVPVVMVAVGFQFRLRLPEGAWTPLTLALGFKLLLSPLIAWGVVNLAGWSGPPAEVAVFEAGMAPMITAGAVAIAAGLAPELIAAIVGLGILCSFPTLTLVHALL